MLRGEGWAVVGVVGFSFSVGLVSWVLGGFIFCFGFWFVGMSREYKRGMEDLLDILYYLVAREKDLSKERMLRILNRVKAAVLEDKVYKLMDELGLV